jgi:hypothetical protein
MVMTSIIDRFVGVYLQRCAPSEFSISNTIRRVLLIIREEYAEKEKRHRLNEKENVNQVNTKMISSEWSTTPLTLERMMSNNSIDDTDTTDFN